MSTTPNLNQVHYRVRTDTGGVDATPTWAAAEDTGASLAVETTFRIRFVVQNTGTAFSTAPFALRVSKNAGAYTAVTTTSGATLGAQSADASSSADGDALNTQRLTAGTGTYTTWSYDETGSIPGATLPNGQYCEIEWGLILKTAGTAAGNTFDFRIYHATSTAFTTYAQTPRVTCVSNEKALLANDVISTSSVSPAPQLRQEHVGLANDVVSASSVSQPALVMRRDLLANDVISGSSVSQPALVAVAGPTALLANDVLSASSVGQPAATILRGLLANDVKSNSSVGQPAVKALHGLLANDVKSNSTVGNPALKALHGLLANDVLSASSVSQPAAQQRQALLANDVLSASSVGQPAAHQVHGLDAANIISASFVSNPAVAGPGGILAEDLVSASSVTSPGLLQTQVLDAAEVKSPSSVSQPALTEIAGSVEQALLADDVVSGSSVSQPMLDRPEVELPELGGGGGKVYGRGYSRKRWEELLRQLEQERQAALEKADTFAGEKGKARAYKAAVAASEAIAAAWERADEAAAIAHAEKITRLLEDATRARKLVDYLALMKAAQQEAIEMELDDDDESVLMLVA